MRLALGLDLPERRIGLSAHDFAQLLGAREAILSHAAKIDGAPTVPSRFIQRLAAIAGRAMERDCQARRNLSRLGPRARPARACNSGPATGADAAAPRAAKRPFGDRDRGLAARPLYDLRAACSASARHSMRSIPNRRRGARHHYSRRRRRLYAEFRGRSSCRSGARTDRARRTALRRAGRFSGSASVLVAAFPAHRALVRALGRRAASARLPRSPPKSGAKPRSRLAMARSACAASPTASNATPPDVASFSITRLAPCAAKNRCAPALRRSSRWKPRFCAVVDLPVSRRHICQRDCLCEAQRRRTGRRI